MIKVDKKNYEQYNSLFRKLKCHLAVKATLDGLTSCDLFTDSLSNTEIAIIKSNNRYFIEINGNKSAFEKLVNFLKNIKDENNKYFQIYFSNETTGKKFLKNMKNWNHKTFDIVKYRVNTCKYKEKTDFREKIDFPDLLKILTAKEVIHDEDNYENIDKLKEEMCSERKNVEDFLNKSFGLCLLFDNQIIGWCLSEYNTQNSCEVGIAIDEKYRNKLLGTYLAEQFVLYSKKMGMKEIHWNSLKINIPSTKTAIKAGFEKELEYKEILVY